MLYFSPSTCGFYYKRVNKDIPADAVSVTEAERDAVMSSAPGQRVCAGPDGKPILADAAMSHEEAMYRLRAIRGRALVKSDLSQFADRQAAMTAEQVAEWAAYRQALRDLPEVFADNPEAVVLPDAPGDIG